MPYVNTVVLLAVLGSLGGCAAVSGLPNVTPAPPSGQYKLQSATHWNAIAQDIATQTTHWQRQRADRSPPIYVSPPAGGEFAQALHNALVTHLVQQGTPTTTASGNALTLHYETQLIRHPSTPYTRPRFPGPLTALAAGLAVARNVSVPLDAIAGVAVGTDLGLSLANQLAPTDTEIVVTTTIMDGALYAMRKTDVYYVRDEEASKYFANRKTGLAPAKTMEVRNP